jgi:hypothetical protein
MTDNDFYDFKINSGGGVAEPVFADIDLYPAALDTPLGATEQRRAWLECNVLGTAAQKALVEASSDWMNAHPECDYVDREAWIFARNTAVRDLDSTVNACTRASVAALKAYRDKQRAGYSSKGARTAFRAAWLDADTRAVAAFAALDAALEERESLMRYVVNPEQSARIGYGHWAHSTALVLPKGIGAVNQRNEMRVIVNAAPRVPVAQAIAAAAAKASVK